MIPLHTQFLAFVLFFHIPWRSTGKYLPILSDPRYPVQFPAFTRFEKGTGIQWDWGRMSVKPL